jgi:hypothetical protein
MTAQRHGTAGIAARRKAVHGAERAAYREALERRAEHRSKAVVVRDGRQVLVPAPRADEIPAQWHAPGSQARDPATGLSHGTVHERLADAWIHVDANGGLAGLAVALEFEDALLEEERQAVSGRGDAYEQVESSIRVGGDTARDGHEGVEEGLARRDEFRVAGLVQAMGERLRDRLTQ